MKTIRNTQTKELRRVENKEAYQRVGYGWEFVPKSLWKETHGRLSSTTPKKSKKVSQ